LRSNPSTANKTKQKEKEKEGRISYITPAEVPFLSSWPLCENVS
jgi:hypothetical protein